MKPHDRGKRGEELAVEYLERRGWTVLGRNLRHGRLEVDLVAARGRVVAIVEVKARGGSRFGHPLEAVTERKQAEVAKAARGILRRLTLPASCLIRFDVIGIEWYPSHNPKITHVPDAWRLG